MANKSFSALPEVLDLELYAGDDYFITISLQNVGSGNLELDKAEINSHLRINKDDFDNYGEMEAIIDEEKLLVKIHLTHELTQSMPPKSYYDVEMKIPVGDTVNVKTLVRGQILLESDITRPPRVTDAEPEYVTEPEPEPEPEEPEEPESEE